MVEGGRREKRRGEAACMPSAHSSRMARASAPSVAEARATVPLTAAASGAEAVRVAACTRSRHALKAQGAGDQARSVPCAARERERGTVWSQSI